MRKDSLFRQCCKKSQLIGGFILLEILVVIAIIGIISSIILSGLNESRAKARLAKAQEIMRGIVPILNICSNDSYSIRECPPQNGEWGGCGAKICPQNPADIPEWPKIGELVGGIWKYQQKIPSLGEGPDCVAGGPMGNDCLCELKTAVDNPVICARGKKADYQRYGIKCTLAGCKTFTYASDIP